MKKILILVCVLVCVIVSGVVFATIINKIEVTDRVINVINDESFSITFEHTLTDLVLNTSEDASSIGQDIKIVNSDVDRTLKVKLDEVKTPLNQDCDYENDCITDCYIKGEEIKGCNGSFISHSGQTEKLYFVSTCQAMSCTQQIHQNITLSD